MNARCWVNRTDVTHPPKPLLFPGKRNSLYGAIYNKYYYSFIFLSEPCVVFGRLQRWQSRSLQMELSLLQVLWASRRSLNPPPETPLKPFIRVRNCLLKTYFCQETCFSLREKKEVETSHAAFTFRSIHGYEQHRYYLIVFTRQH